MKKFITASIAVLMSLSAYLQTEIEIDFGIVQNGSQLVLDSVLIENQTLGCDTMIYNSQAGFVIDIISGMKVNQSGESSKLSVKQNYPNPFSDETIIEVYNPENELNVKIFDTAGKMILKENFITGKGAYSFSFIPGDSKQYIASFSCSKQEQSIKMTNSGSSVSKPTLKLLSQVNLPALKNLKSGPFVYNQGDVLTFTGFVTVCHEAESTSVTDSPLVSQTYNFDFTYITDIQPDAPIKDELSVTENTINWSWTSITEATGYKYNFTNNYSESIDLSEQTTYLQEELIAGTNYKVFVWAYNECGESFPVRIDTATTALPLTQDEIDLILSGESTEDMYVMNICVQPDTLVLRAISTNVIIGEENLQQLTDRMKVTVLGTGVGIAAPQIGINRRIIWVQRYDKGSAIHPWELYFNPRIVAYSDTVALRSDGCLSVPDGCVNTWDIVGNSYRSKWVDVEYYLEDGTFVHERISHQYTAHIFQHEIDHLYGIMFFDRQLEEVPEEFTIIEGDSYEGLPIID
ncbi:MAG TPA: peptide deformylase [Bacteroidales bacterium]|nr:peptide deformylase [Bacteroidales bacterium]